MNDAQKVIVHLLARIGGKVHSTRLVKLVYLADYIHSQHFGRTITGFTYHWDHYGPNAVGHAIMAEAEKLAETGVVASFSEPNMYGTYSTLFRVTKEASIPKLDPEAETVVHDVLARFGKMSLTSLVAASKRTAPFKSASQYQLLDLPKKVSAAKTASDDYKAYQKELTQYGTQSLDEVKATLGVS